MQEPSVYVRGNISKSQTDCKNPNQNRLANFVGCGPIKLTDKRMNDHVIFNVLKSVQSPLHFMSATGWFFHGFKKKTPPTLSQTIGGTYLELIESTKHK